MLRRAAAGAPTDHIRETLEDIASREDAMAKSLGELLETPDEANDADAE